MNVPFIDLAWQETQIRKDREQSFAEIINNSAYVLGPHVAAFEAAFSVYIGTEHAIGVSGGSQALGMSYRGLGIGEGDEVITIPTTFIASVTGLVEAGARPVFVDIDPRTRNFNLAALERLITPRTKALLPVHLYGLPADMDAIMAIAETHSLVVIEDACQAHGARYKGKRVGSFGNAAAFSFYPGKNLGAYGDGGSMVTDDSTLADMVRALRNQGCVEKYDHEYLGYNGRLDALQAAVLSAKLPHLDAWNSMRRVIAERYIQALSELPLGIPNPLPDTEPVWHLFVVEVPEGEREPFREHLAARGIATGVHYPIPLHLTKALAFLKYGVGSFPEAEKLAKSCVSLPLFPGMTEAQTDWVVTSVRDYFHGT